MEKVVAKMQESFLPNKKQVLVSHFFVAGSEKTDSETKLTVGGLDVVPTALLEPFDYVALATYMEKMRCRHLMLDTVARL